MNISKDTQDVVAFLQDLSGGNLRKPNDLGVFMEIGASYGLENLMNEFIFNGASIWNLSQALKKTKQGEESFSKIEKELNENLKIFCTQINKFLSFSESEIIDRIGKIYLQGSTGSVLNIIDLAHDLSELKYVQNTIKSKKK